MRISNKSVMQFPLSVPGASERWPGGCKNGPGSLQIIYKIRLQTDKLSCTTVPSQNGFRLRRHRRHWVFGPKIPITALPWRAAGPFSPVSPELQRRGPLLNGLAWLCILVHGRIYQVTRETGLPLPPSQGHLTQDFWTDLSAVVMAHLVHAVGHVNDGQKLPRMFLESFWPGGHPIS